MIQAPTSQDRAAWKDTRIGRFTASKFGALMTQPRNKADREAGKFSAEGAGYIFAKAIERLTGVPMDDAGATSTMRRGLLLEPAALHILSSAWKPCDACTWQAYGDILGSTPDALVDAGGGTMDLKCPANPADVVRFAVEVPNGDFDALIAWDRNYAWQIMVQALTCGSDTAHLVYFTDRLPIHKLTPDERDAAQLLIDAAADRYSGDNLYPWEYQYASDGYFFAARSFLVTEEVKDRILSTLARAEAECQRIMGMLPDVLGMTPGMLKDLGQD